mmetsp:Transcript_15371/g.26907  ORF Transcript_15371/g.26907 Transcript_15371/m.26907 type:complete len:667 (+) Transcript_15371:135-2135(+)
MAFLRFLAVASCLAPGFSVRDSTVEETLSTHEEPDGYEDAFTHFHVTPSSHRSLLASHERDDSQGVTLAVIFAVHPAATMVGLTFPKGYSILDVAENKHCAQVIKPNEHEISTFAKETNAQSVVEHILSCSVKEAPGDEESNKSSDDEGSHLDSLQNTGPGMQIILSLHDKVQGLSVRDYTLDTPTVKKMQWWYFHVQVSYPSRNIEPQDNFFKLHWSHTHDRDWEGETIFRSWPILGDWECRYSDWEGFGTCSSRCGGGTRQLTRRVLFQPVGGGSQCNETLHPDIQPCNDHPCLWGCEIEDDLVDSRECTASCGGGVILKRRRFRGEHCPMATDMHADIAVQCNTQPCRTRCEHSDVWQVVTQCDELCGMGHFWMMRPVIRKASDDTACRPQWKQVPCMRRVCTQFAVTHPDPNLLPTPEQEYQVGLSWTQQSLASEIKITAPEGYSFGDIGKKCDTVFLRFHSLMPHFESCQVGDHENLAILHLNTPLPPAHHGGSKSGGSTGRYEIQMLVKHPPCAPKDWDPDPIRSTLICNVGTDRTVWHIEFPQEGDPRREVLTAQGYYLFWPRSMPVPAILVDQPEEEEEEETTTTAAPAPATRPDVGGGNPNTYGSAPCAPGGLPVERQVAKPVYCMQDRDPGECEEKFAGSKCGWDNVCKVIANAPQ